MNEAELNGAELANEIDKVVDDAKLLSVEMLRLLQKHISSTKFNDINKLSMETITIAFMYAIIINAQYEHTKQDITFDEWFAHMLEPLRMAVEHIKANMDKKESKIN